VVIGRGRLLMDAPIQEVVSGMVNKRVEVRIPEPAALSALGHRLLEQSGRVWRRSIDRLLVEGTTAPELGDLAYEMDIRIHELRTLEGSLEDAYMALTSESVEFGAGAPAQPEFLGARRSS
jgi:ABC-2 type transport system ATP-binding protein